MPEEPHTNPEIEITVETPEGVRVTMKAASDAEAEALKARATAQGNKIVVEEIDDTS